MIKTKKWDKIFLGEIADEITERVDKPSQSGFEMFVGLEHFVSGDLKIKKWVSTKNLVSAMKKFQKGDILFARRNAYLKRASIVEFGGVCSGDAFVIREKKDRLVPGFLAFIFNSESLWHYANSYAAGTMSKRVKWRDLAKYSFKLPPLDEQKRLAGLLWSVDDAVEKQLFLLRELKQLFRTIVEEKLIFLKGKKIQLSGIADDSAGGFIDGDWIESKDQSEEGIRLLQLADIGVGAFLDKSRRFITEETFHRLSCFEVLPGDILLARMPEPLGRACIIPNIGCKMITAVDCCVIRVNEKMHNKHFWMYFLNSDFMRRKMESLASGTTRKRISRKNLERIHICCPGKKDQDRIVRNLVRLTKNMDKVLINIALQKQIRKQLIDQIFG